MFKARDGSTGARCDISLKVAIKALEGKVPELALVCSEGSRNTIFSSVYCRELKLSIWFKGIERTV